MARSMHSDFGIDTRTRLHSFQPDGTGATLGLAKVHA
jgi:hypothetical protein